MNLFVMNSSFCYLYDFIYHDIMTPIMCMLCSIYETDLLFADENTGPFDFNTTNRE